MPKGYCHECKKTVNATQDTGSGPKAAIIYHHLIIPVGSTPPQYYCPECGNRVFTEIEISANKRASVAGGRFIRAIPYVLVIAFAAFVIAWLYFTHSTHDQGVVFDDNEHALDFDHTLVQVPYSAFEAFEYGGACGIAVLVGLLIMLWMSTGDSSDTSDESEFNTKTFYSFCVFVLIVLWIIYIALTPRKDLQMVALRIGEILAIVITVICLLAVVRFLKGPSERQLRASEKSILNQNKIQHEQSGSRLAYRPAFPPQNQTDTPAPPNGTTEYNTVNDIHFQCNNCGQKLVVDRHQISGTTDTMPCPICKHNIAIGFLG